MTTPTALPSKSRIAARLLGQKTTWLRRLAAAAIVTLAAAGAHAEEPQLLGPLRIQDLSPTAMVRMDMLPPPAENDAQWRFEVTTSDANLFSMSDAARGYLESRGLRQPMTEHDGQEMLKRSGDVFFFDGEVEVTNFIIARRLTAHDHIEVIVPYHTYGGGHLDSVVEGFHRRAGLNDAGRTLVPRNEIAIVTRVGTTERVFVSQDGDSGLGDATITLRHSDRLSGRWSYVLEGAVRLPAGKDELYFSSSSPNFGVQASLQRKSERQGLYLSTSYVRPGRSRMLGSTRLGNVPTVIGTYERALGARMSAVAQASWSSGGYRNASVPDLTRTRKQVSVGVRRHYRASAVWLAVTENIATFKNTPDIVVHAGITVVR